MTTNIWLFQANPQIYNLAEDLQNFQVADEDWWDVTRFKNEMKQGDKVILWVAGKQGGVYALGELLSEPNEEKGGTWKVPFRYTHILDRPVLRDTIKGHPILRNMEILRMAQGANKRVTKEEWNALQALITNRNDGNASSRIWKISAGEAGKHWQAFQEHRLIGIGFHKYWEGDLTQFNDYDVLLDTLRQRAKRDAKYKYVADQFWYFHQEMSEGDIILAYGNGAFIGKGRITGPYQFEVASTFPYPHQRPVEWDDSFKEVSNAELSQSLRSKLGKRETIIPLTQEEYEEIVGNGNWPPPSLLDNLHNYFISKGYNFPQKLIATFVTALQTKGFVILSGLSGTGKTKLAQHLAELLPMPEEMTETIEDAINEGIINITVKPDMIKNARIIVPKPFWHLLDIPLEGNSLDISINIDGQSQPARFAHYSRSGGNDYSLLYLKGKTARKWLSNFDVGDTLALNPQSNEDGEFTGFVLARPQAIPVPKRRHLPNHTFIVVRPDWRDSKSLLGYYNPLTGVYEDTSFLRFLLQAKAHYYIAHSQALPHFIILDEMNLARAEYYFADFLSVLESGRDDQGYSVEAIQLHSQDPEQTFGSRGLTIPQSLKLPPNLYIIGTVNMDETTHAFSPKVLDRAFTIEFNEVDFSNYPADNEQGSHPIQINELQRALLIGFQREGKFARIDKTEIANTLHSDNRGYRRHLQILNAALGNYDLHFGYRVFDEIAQFMSIAHKGSLFESLDTAFDVAVLMKVLPKFNGPRSRLRQPLEAVIAWAKNPDSPETEVLTGQLKDASSCRQLMLQLLDEFVYPETARKAMRMLIRLHETGFASFA